MLHCQKETVFNCGFIVKTNGMHVLLLLSAGLWAGKMEWKNIRLIKKNISFITSSVLPNEFRISLQFLINDQMLIQSVPLTGRARLILLSLSAHYCLYVADLNDLVDSLFVNLTLFLPSGNIEFRITKLVQSSLMFQGGVWHVQCNCRCHRQTPSDQSCKLDINYKYCVCYSNTSNYPKNWIWRLLE